MAGVYRLKKCPYCGIEHRKRGPYCSKSHAGLDRSPEVYKKVSDFMKYTDKGREVALNNLNNNRLDELPSVGGLSQHLSDSFVSDGDLWVTDNGDW